MNKLLLLLISGAMATACAKMPHQAADGGDDPQPAAESTASPDTGSSAEGKMSKESEAAWRAVEQWAEAWANGDVDTYIGSYTPDYVPQGGGSHEAWVRQRTARLTKPSKIELKLSNRKVDVTAADRATVSFDQSYKSDTYSDKVRKTLHLHRIGDDWRIAKEASG